MGQPINQREGHIHGWEVAWQHFLGDTGFGDVETLDGFPGGPFRVAVSGRLGLVARKQ